MQWSELEEQSCSVSRALSVVGDRWTLLILRDCFLKVRRFEAFQERLGIGRPILADRLQKLVDQRVLVKIPYQDRPTRYEYRLTQRGLDLYPVLLSIAHWGDVHMFDRRSRPLVYRHKTCGHVFEPVQVCSVCAEALDPREVQAESGPGAPRKNQRASRR
jgi:DNA-binding HxlR family transcriptional regulator